MAYLSFKEVREPMMVTSSSLSDASEEAGGSTDSQVPNLALCTGVEVMNERSEVPKSEWT